MPELVVHLLWVLGSLVVLYFGAEWLVNGAIGISNILKIPSLVIGLTVVALGTSAPELLVCLKANLNDAGDIALGNIVGSNICNIALVLGFTALLKTIIFPSQIIKRDGPILVVATFLLIWMLSDKVIDLNEGLALLIFVIIYTMICFLISKNKGDEFEVEETNPSRPAWISVFIYLALLAVGGILLKYSSDFLVIHGQNAATLMGVSEAFIALFLFAFGTSFPELATSVVAVKKSEEDLVVGNIIGSCIFNIFAVLGITSIVKPVVEENIAQLDKMIMLGVTVGLLLIAILFGKINRFVGALFLLLYLSYCVVRYLSI